MRPLWVSGVWIVLKLSRISGCPESDILKTAFGTFSGHFQDTVEVLRMSWICLLSSVEYFQDQTMSTLQRRAISGQEQCPEPCTKVYKKYEKCTDIVLILSWKCLEKCWTISEYFQTLLTQSEGSPWIFLCPKILLFPANTNFTMFLLFKTPQLHFLKATEQNLSNGPHKLVMRFKMVTCYLKRKYKVLSLFSYLLLYFTS